MSELVLPRLDTVPRSRRQGFEDTAASYGMSVRQGRDRSMRVLERAHERAQHLGLEEPLGKSFYEQQGEGQQLDELARRTGVSREVAAMAVSTTSTQMKWDQPERGGVPVYDRPNLRVAQHAIEEAHSGKPLGQVSRPPGFFSSDKTARTAAAEVRAVEAGQGAPYEVMHGGRRPTPSKERMKHSSFMQNWLQPGNPANRATMDVWESRIQAPHLRKEVLDQARGAAGPYLVMDEANRRASEAYGLTPEQGQAVKWFEARNFGAIQPQDRGRARGSARRAGVPDSRLHLPDTGDQAWEAKVPDIGPTNPRQFADERGVWLQGDPKGSRGRRVNRLVFSERADW